MRLRNSGRNDSSSARRIRASASSSTSALSPNPWIAVPGILIAGYSFTTGNTQISTRLQQLAPDELRGRVLSVNSLAFNGVMPFATMGVSFLAAAIGQSWVMLGSAVILVGASILLWKRYVWKAFIPPEPVVVEGAPAG